MSVWKKSTATIEPYQDSSWDCVDHQFVKGRGIAPAFSVLPIKKEAGAMAPAFELSGRGRRAASSERNRSKGSERE